MKLIRFRRPSLSTLLGITRIKKRFNKATGLNKINRLKKNRIKQRLLYKSGWYKYRFFTWLRLILK